jgi:hypothetical protein
MRSRPREAAGEEAEAEAEEAAEAAEDAPRPQQALRR